MDVRSDLGSWITKHQVSAQFWKHCVESACKFVQVCGRHSRKEMMLGVIEHGIGEQVQPLPALGAAGFMRAAAVVDRPDGKKSGKTFAHKHGANVPAQCDPVLKEAHHGDR